VLAVYGCVAPAGAGVFDCFRLGLADLSFRGRGRPRHADKVKSRGQECPRYMDSL
jgi:hypothetical protein